MLACRCKQYRVVGVDHKITNKAKLYANWLSAFTGCFAEIMTGLHTHRYEAIALNSEGLKSRGWDSGLPGDCVVEGAMPLLVGGYNEERAIYSGPAFEPENGEEARTVHLGIDIFAPAGTPVFAPLEGQVHSFQDNANPKDYGPTIVLEHAVTSKLTFYTLYGHLSRESLEGLVVGQTFGTGQQIATLGAPTVNGDWPPHLHFQIILDTLGKRGDFPGVCKKSERADWLQLCPDPASLLRLG